MIRRMPWHARGWLPALALLALSGAASAAAPAPEQLLPATTTEFVAVSDLARMEEAWGRTSLARLIADPAMKPFLDEVWPTFKGSNYLVETIGVGWDSVKAAAGGDLGWGVVLVNEKEVAHVLTLDLAGRDAGAKAFFTEIGQKLHAKGAKFSQRTLDGMSLVVADLPDGKQIVYGLKDTVMVATDHFGTLQGILARWTGAATNSLASTMPYQKVRARTQPQPGETPFIRWYFEPIARVEAQLVFQPQLKKVKGDNVSQVLRKEGVDAIKGVGGTLAFSCNGVQILARGSAYAPGPFRGAMRMAKLPNETLPTPEPWVPADVSAWVTVSIDLVNALDSFDTLFERLADEEPGTFQEVLKSLKDDPNGPQVDVRREIFEQLANRVTLINDATTPIMEKSERFLLGVPAKDPAAEQILAGGLRKCMANDERITSREIAGVRVWEYRPKATKAARKKATEPVVTVPTLAFAVARGHLFITTHADLLQKVLTQAGPAGLGAATDFQQFTGELARLGMGPSSTRSFARVVPGARTSYEMMRAGRLNKVESVYAHILLQLVKLDADGNRLRADGSKLPPYAAVEPYLGLAGSFSTTHDDGWSAVAVTLRRQ